VCVTFASMGGNLYWYKLELLFIIGSLFGLDCGFVPGLVWTLDVGFKVGLFDGV
jgi:hypothetical protein